MIKHGCRGTRLYRIWDGIKQRCFNPVSHSYKDYGGRGIKLCTEWFNFTTFKNWALRNGYAGDLTIDRIDVNGNYCPENCRWATVKEQSNNKRTSHLITFKGETKTLVQWAEELGIDKKTINTRLNLGWSTEKALTEPVKDIGRRMMKHGDSPEDIY